MQIVASDQSMKNYLKAVVEIDIDKLVLVDKYIRGKEVEVDAERRPPGICSRLYGVCGTHRCALGDPIRYTPR